MVGNLWSPNMLAQGMGSSFKDISGVYVLVYIERARGERKHMGGRVLLGVLMPLGQFRNAVQKYAGMENVPGKERSKGTIKAGGGLITTYGLLYVNN